MKVFIRRLGISLGLLAAFAVFTTAVRCVDVQAIGPEGSSVGFAAINRFVHRMTGVHLTLYVITDWLSLLLAAVCVGFGTLGLRQWIRRRRILKVDGDLLILGGFYVIVMAVYVFFEACIVNYRPVLIEGVLEASYPSSTTMLVMCVMPTAMMQLKTRMKNTALSRWTIFALAAYSALMILLRLVSGVHWLTDIVGGTLLSAGLVALYAAGVSLVSLQPHNN